MNGASHRKAVSSPGVPRALYKTGDSLMRELSIFNDELGDVGSCSDYYLVGFAFHDQWVDISASINRYRRSLSDAGLIERTSHFIPVIRGHEQYTQIDLSVRKRNLMRF